LVDCEGESLNSFFQILTEWEQQLKPLQSELLGEDGGSEQ
jgi:hypothetical protein